MTGVLVFGAMAQKAEKSGNLYRLTGLLEVERPDGPCFHIHNLDDFRIICRHRLSGRVAERCKEYPTHFLFIAY